VLLRKESEEFLVNKRDALSGDEEVQGLFQLIALGTAGMYYYLGILLKTLHDEGYYKEGKIPPVYLGGNGARIFNWLSEGGRFDHNREINGLFNQMMYKASGFQDNLLEVSTYMSSRPKDEVACGLVLNDSHLTGWQNIDKINSRLISGEFCIINGEDKMPYSRLPNQSVSINNFEIPMSFNSFRSFLNDFNEALTTLKADTGKYPAGIKPIDVDESDFSYFHRELQSSLLKQRGNVSEIRFEPPFILVLKAMLTVYSKRLAG
jgi:hypothetical protein